MFEKRGAEKKKRRRKEKNRGKGRNEEKQEERGRTSKRQKISGCRWRKKWAAKVRYAGDREAQIEKKINREGPKSPAVACS